MSFSETMSEAYKGWRSKGDMHKDLIRGKFEVELVGEIAMGKRRTLGMIAYRHTEVGGEIYLHWTEPKKKHLGIGTLMVTDVR